MAFFHSSYAWSGLWICFHFEAVSDGVFNPHALRSNKSVKIKFYSNFKDGWSIMKMFYKRILAPSQSGFGPLCQNCFILSSATKDYHHPFFSPGRVEKIQWKRLLQELIYLFITVQSECIEKYQFELCSQYDREYDLMSYLDKCFLLVKTPDSSLFLNTIIIYLQSECVEKYQFELCSKYDREYDFDVILG